MEFPIRVKGGLPTIQKLLIQTTSYSKYFRIENSKGKISVTLLAYFKPKLKSSVHIADNIFVKSFIKLCGY